VYNATNVANTAQLLCQKQGQFVRGRQKNRFRQFRKTGCT
jgi:hypothetical protein